MIYEYPLNIQIQTCLILEKLFQEGDFHLKLKTPYNNFQSLKIILKIMKIIEHREVKIKLIQTLQNYAQKIKAITLTKQIDKRKLHNVLKQINYYVESTTHEENSLTELRQNYFLTMMKSNYLQGQFNTNDAFFQAWLQQNEVLRSPQLLHWFGTFNQLREMVNLSLKLLRSSVNWVKAKAVKGSYSVNQPAQLIRINVNELKSVYPRFEIYQHSSNINFYHLEINSAVPIIDYDLNFDLALCKL